MMMMSTIKTKQNKIEEQTPTMNTTITGCARHENYV